MELDNKRISIICQDFYNSITDQGMTDFEELFPITFQLGKLVKLCESLRSDINEEKEIEISIVKKLMNACGFHNMHDFILKELEEMHLINNKETTIIFNPEKQVDVLNILGQYWRKQIEESSTKNFEMALISIILALEQKFLTEEEKEYFLSNIEELKQKEILIVLLKQLNLIKYLDKEGIYYSPNTFGHNIKKAEEQILTILKNSKIKDYEHVISSIKENPGIPYSELNTHQNTLNNLIQTGLIDPIEVQVGQDKIPFLWMPNEKEDDKLFWVKKTASHFKFGQLFAKTKGGRLNDPSLFINRLLSRGYAGNASNIGIGYNPLVLNRIVKVGKRGLSGRYTMYPIKKDILSKVESMLECGKVFEVKQQPLTYYLERLKNPNQARLNPILTDIKEKETQESIKKALEILKNE